MASPGVYALRYVDFRHSILIELCALENDAPDEETTRGGIFPEDLNYPAALYQSTFGLD